MGRRLKSWSVYFTPTHPQEVIHTLKNVSIALMLMIIQQCNAIGGDEDFDAHYQGDLDGNTLNNKLDCTVS